MKRRTQRVKYVATDFMSAAILWFLFNIIRYHELGASFGFGTLSSYLSSDMVVKGQLLVPFFWVALHYLSGYYNRPLGKSRLDEFLATVITVLTGSLLLFFIFVLNDLPSSSRPVYRYLFYDLFFDLLALSFFFIYIPRLFITQIATKKIQKREWTTRVLVIGSGEKAEETRSRLERPTKAMSYSVVAIIDPNETGDLHEIIKENHVSELIVAIDGYKNEETLLKTLYELYQYNLPIKIPPGNNRLLRGKVKVRSVSEGIPLIDLSSNNLSDMGKNIKFVMDKVVSLLALIVLSPLYAFLAWRVRSGSEGSILFRQQRIGYMGKPFTMYKFRTMRENAEADGPSLSSLNDQRITRFGLFLRKYRLDELPQFWNILKGDMSLVGPRPERKYYIDQIVKEAPWFYLLHNTRPGLTSWGMVKYGYATGIDEMIERLQYDMIYYENMSLLTDLKILIYTVRTIFTGKGV